MKICSSALRVRLEKKPKIGLHLCMAPAALVMVRVKCVHFRGHAGSHVKCL